MIERNSCKSIEYVIYRPEQYADIEKLPVVVLFRGKPEEWFQARQDSSRGKRNAYLVISDLIAKGFVKPAAYLFPTSCSEDGDEFYFCEDLKAADKRSNKTPYLTKEIFENELLPQVCEQYDLDLTRISLDGFSLGGYTSLVYSFLSPERYKSTGSFDAAILDYEYDNLEVNPETKSDLRFDFFPYIFDGIPSIEEFEKIDPVTQVLKDRAVPENLYICCSGSNVENSNKPRVMRLKDAMDKQGVRNHAESTVVDLNSSHEWFWVDEYLYRCLPFHTHVLNN
jgi:S-formylglutathione hydrolase FrmB